MSSQQACRDARTNACTTTRLEVGRATGMPPVHACVSKICVHSGLCVQTCTHAGVTGPAGCGGPGRRDQSDTAESDPIMTTNCMSGFSRPRRPVNVEFFRLRRYPVFTPFGVFRLARAARRGAATQLGREWVLIHSFGPLRVGHRRSAGRSPPELALVNADAQLGSAPCWRGGKNTSRTGMATWAVDEGAKPHQRGKPCWP